MRSRLVELRFGVSHRDGRCGQIDAVFYARGPAFDFVWRRPEEAVRSIELSTGAFAKATELAINHPTEIIVKIRATDTSFLRDRAMMN